MSLIIVDSDQRCVVLKYRRPYTKMTCQSAKGGAWGLHGWLLSKASHVWRANIKKLKMAFIPLQFGLFFNTSTSTISSVFDRKRIQIDYNSDFFPIFSASFIFSEVLKEIESKRYFFVIQGKPEIARIHVCGGFLCSLYHTLWKRFFKHHIQRYTYSKSYGHLKKKKKKRKEKNIVLVKLHTGSSICL